MGVDTGDSNSLVALAEIKGDIKLVLAGQERTHADISTINKRLDVHDRRLVQLETDRSVREGERRGVSFSGRIALALASLAAGTGLGTLLGWVK